MPAANKAAIRLPDIALFLALTTTQTAALLEPFTPPTCGLRNQ